MSSNGSSVVPALLSVEDLHVSFSTEGGSVQAVRGVSFQVGRGETVGIVGESGSGKSTALQAVMRLIPEPPGRVSALRIEIDGKDLLYGSKELLATVRGQEIAMIFQDALASLNPSLTVGYQIGEMYRVRNGASRKETKTHVVELLGLVGIPNPELRYRSYPHEFSGGMRQRAMIACALSLDPAILIADEPTTALDVTVQQQVLELLSSLQERLQMSTVLITHDMAVISQMADRLLVMYAGRIVESGPTQEILRNPQHPYTAALISSIPDIAVRTDRLVVIPGAPPMAGDVPPGCPFHPRCELARDICKEVDPELEVRSASRMSACHFAEEVNIER